MKDKVKTLIFDIETGAGVNGFKSDLSIALVICYKWLGEKKVYTLSILDNKDLNKLKVQDWDTFILQIFSNIVSHADILVGHYSSVFDKKFLSGRLLIHGLKPMPPITQIDTCLEARKIAKFSSNRLGHLAKVLQLNNRKTDKNWPEAWVEVTRNPSKHIKGMIPYCKGDVLATEELYLKLLPFMNNKGKENIDTILCICPKCGSKHIQRRGRALTTTNSYQRYQCQDCGTWFRSNETLHKIKSRSRDL